MAHRLFKECVEALGTHAVQLSFPESDKIIELFEQQLPIVDGGSRIDWNKMSKKMQVDSPVQITITLQQLLKKPIDRDVYLFWNDGGLPVLKTDIDTIIHCFNDVISVGFETWLFNPHAGYIVECYYLGDITVGLINKHCTQ